MFRFVLVIACHFISALVLTAIMKVRLARKGSTTLQRWKTASGVIRHVARLSNTKVLAFGQENLPGTEGYMMFANHQGRFDGIAVSAVHERPMSFVLKSNRGDKVMEKDFLNLVRAVPIDVANARQCMESFGVVKDRVKAGECFCIFPEGIYGDNGNTLQEFKTGCFHYLKQTACPIVPVCIYDSWRVFNYRKFRECLRRVTVQVHYLKPIQVQEYMDLSKVEIAQLVRSRIQEKMDELTSAEQIS